MFESRNEPHTTCDHFPRWLGDIGGTNARFGWQTDADGHVDDVLVLPCAEFDSLAAAAAAYLQRTGKTAPACAAFGIANPVFGDAIAMTNHHWKFSVSALRQTLGLQRLVMLNDFAALALALPTLPPSALRQVGSGERVPNAAIGILGPGTGMGVSGLLPVGHQNKWLPLAGEGGHVTLAATTDWEHQVLTHLRARYGHVSLERVVSGLGLVDLYHAICDIKGTGGREIITAAHVLERANAEPGSSANDAIEMFCAFLGDAAGNLALTLGARGGIFIGGGIVPRLGQRFEASAFRARFEAKGRFEKYLQAIPTLVIESKVSPALYGASRALDLGVW
jgi:glucokinase